MNYSKAIFGSTLRSNSDKYSDYDLLIVADSAVALNELKKSYDNSKWSVSYYLYSRIQKIADKGGLFIQHLKMESSILIDDNNQLKNILDQYKPKESYLQDILNSSDFFLYFNKFHLSDSSILNGWLSDVIYVGLRNLLIYQHAEIHKYEFSFINLLCNYKDQLSEENILSLKDLRIYRRNYRERSLEIAPSNDYICNLYRILKKLEIIPSFDFCAEDDFNNIINIHISDTSTDPYIKLRLVEAKYILAGIENEKISNIIKNPQIYTFNFKDQDFINEILNLIEQEVELIKQN